MGDQSKDQSTVMTLGQLHPCVACRGLKWEDCGEVGDNKMG